MKQLFLIVASVSVFGMLTACGDSFKSAGSDAQDPEKVIEAGRSTDEDGREPNAREQAIIDRYQAEIDDNGKDANDTLHAKLQGFNIKLNELQGPMRPGDAAVYIADASMMIGPGCSSSEERIISRSNVTMEILKEDDLSFLGDNGPSAYQVVAHCTDDECGRMIGVVRENTKAVILINLVRRMVDNGETHIYSHDPADKVKGLYGVTDFDAAFNAQLRCEAAERVGAETDENFRREAFGEGSTGEEESPLNGGSSGQSQEDAEADLWTGFLTI